LGGRQTCGLSGLESGVLHISAPAVPCGSVGGNRHDRTARTLVWHASRVASCRAAQRTPREEFGDPANLRIRHAFDLRLHLSRSERFVNLLRRHLPDRLCCRSMVRRRVAVTDSAPRLICRPPALAAGRAAARRSCRGLSWRGIALSLLWKNGQRPNRTGDTGEEDGNH
jgi:hypothetical protein